MEAVGTISEVEWNSSFNRACSEEADFMAQLLGSCSLPNDLPTASSFWPQNESCIYSSAETYASTIFSFSLGSSSYIEGNNILFPSSHHESSYPFVSTVDFKTDLVDGKKSDNLIEGDDFLNKDISNDSIESDGKISGDVVVHGIKKETAVSESYKVDEIIIPTEMSKKRPKVPGELQRSKKLKKCAETDNNTKAVIRRSSSNCFSENDSNASSSHEMNGVTSSSSSKGSVSLNLNGKTRANRGSATDPQSLYARKRRERINERLRILQNLVPNGTKVDISTMLEEAVQYVKFLQLQIKLLSSDELWMYAPIAYNGMDLRLDFNTPPTPNPQSQ